MKKTAVVLLTHFLDRSIFDMFYRLRTEAPEGYDIFLALNLGDETIRTPPEAAPIADALFLCNIAKLLALSYPEKCKAEGWSGNDWKSVENVDTILLSFYRAHPGYAFYWGIEYDVHYQGEWGFLFRRFEASKADLLGTMLDKASKTPKKILMPPFRDADGNPPEYSDAVVGFYPLHRLSNRMLRTIDACYRQGWNGHYEFTWGTMAKRHGMEIEDIGGSGPYVKSHNRNVFYFNTIGRWDMSPGTFVFRPAFTTMPPKRENTLWHPVKAQGNYFNHCPALPEKNAYGLIKRVAKYTLYKTAIWAWFVFRWRPATLSPLPVAEIALNKRSA